MQDYFENEISCPKWLCDDTSVSDVVLGGEVLFIRNLADTPFPLALPEDKREQIGENLSDELENYFENHFPLNKLQIQDRYYYWERFLLPYPLIVHPEYGHLLLDSDETLSAVVNGLDHISVRYLMNDIDFDSMLDGTEDIIGQLGEKFDWATHSQFGYLSSNPANCGAGVILSAFCHIAGTVIANKFDHLRDIAKAHGLGIGNLWGQGLDTGSSFVRIYTKHLVGKTAEQLKNNIMIALDAIIELERDSREYLLYESEIFLKDKINRAYGTVAYANLLERWEFPNLLSSFRLGASMSILPISVRTVDELLILGQQAHITKQFPDIESPLDILKMRAKLVREKLAIL